VYVGPESGLVTYFHNGHDPIFAINDAERLSFFHSYFD